MNPIDVKRQVLERLDTDFLTQIINEFYKPDLYYEAIVDTPTGFTYDFFKLNDKRVDTLYERIRIRYENELNMIYNEILNEYTRKVTTPPYSRSNSTSPRQGVNEYGVPYTVIDEIIQKKQNELNQKREAENKIIEQQIESAKEGEYYRPDLNVGDNYYRVITHVEKRPLTIPKRLKYPGILFLVPTIGEGSCFFHSFLTAIKDPDYLAATDREKRHIAVNFRKYLIAVLDSIDPETGQPYSDLFNFQEINYPDDIRIEFKKRSNGQVDYKVTVVPSNIEAGGLTKFNLQKNLVKGGCTDYIGEDGIVLIDKLFNIQTIVIDPDFKTQTALKPYTDIGPDDAIQVFLYSGAHYQPIGEETIEPNGTIVDKLLFKRDDPLIQFIYNLNQY